jgi:hypothetical protein
MPSRRTDSSRLRREPVSSHGKRFPPRSRASAQRPALSRRPAPGIARVYRCHIRGAARPGALLGSSARPQDRTLDLHQLRVPDDSFAMTASIPAGSELDLAAGGTGSVPCRTPHERTPAERQQLGPDCQYGRPVAPANCSIRPREPLRTRDQLRPYSALPSAGARDSRT